VYREFYIRLILSLICINIFYCGISQQQQNKLNEFTQLKGLPAKITTSVFKDSRGFIWFGSENGLYRYDGYEFKGCQYNPADTSSISGNFITSILFEDDQGNLWIGTQANGLNIYNPKTDSFQHFIHQREYPFEFDFNQVHLGLQDRDGYVWLASESGAGLICFDKESGLFETYINNEIDFLSWDNWFSSLYEDSKGNLWIGTYNGMFNFNRGNKTFIKLDSLVSLPEQMINQPVGDIFEDRNGVLWIGSYIGLIKFDVPENKIDLYRFDVKDPNTLSANRILAIYENPLDKGRSLWVITIRGINKFDKNTGLVTRYLSDPDNPENKSFAAINDTYLEENGTLWAATGFAGGVRYNLNTSPFTEYSIGPFENDPYKYEATTFLHDRKGYLWVGTNFNGLYKFDEKMHLVAHYNHDPNDPKSLTYSIVFSLFEDSDGVLWVGNANNLDVFDNENACFIHCALPEVMNYEFTRINDIFQDSYGTLWIAATGGAYYQNKERELDTSFQRINMKIDPLTDYRCFADDSKGNLWLGCTTGEGLYLLTPENRDSLAFINYRHNPDDPLSLGDNVIYSLLTDKNGILWCGTTNGLSRFDVKKDSFTRFNKTNGLISRIIYNIKEDDFGQLWLSTEVGIVRFRLLNDTVGESYLLEREDGIPFDDNYQYKIYKGKDGKIYVGGSRYSGNGFYCLDPEFLENDRIPPVVLTELLITNKLAGLDTCITEKKHIHLDYSENSFTFKFAALDFVSPSKNNYAYMLEGLDNDWTYSANMRLANYTNVPPGEYIFRVKGSNNDGIWNETGASLSISISAPPWKTWWAYSLYVLFIIAVFYSIAKIYLYRQKILHDLEIKQLEASNLEELNKEKSRFFANISHEFRTPLTLIIGPAKRIVSKIKENEIVSDLNVILNNANHLQNLINQLLNLAKLESGKLQLKAEETDIASLVRGYYQSFESAAREKSIELVFKSDQEEILVFVDREKMEKILYNLVSNALKFTPDKGKIEVSVDSRQLTVGSKNTVNCQTPTVNFPENCAIIRISDTGTGISPTHLSHIFDRFYQVDDSYTRDQEGTGIGLTLAKELVELHHGKIHVESEVGKGTTFKILLPLGREHLSEEELETSQQSAVGSQPPPRPSPGMVEGVREGLKPGISKDIPLLLIVEDNRDMRNYLRTCLQENYRIREAGNGEAGLEQAFELIPDLVISDVMMSKMDGYQLCEKLKSDERTSHIPVILLTALTSVESKIEGLETGADDFLSKPFDTTELQVRVKNLIDQRRKLTEKFIKNASRLGLSEILNLPESGMASIDEKFLQRSVEVIQHHISNPDFNVDNLADNMNMSRPQFYRKLHALTGLSPNGFIRYNRLQKAAQLLSHHAANVAEIAYDVGFNNPSYFSKCFKEQFGVLPSEYKA